MPIPRFNRRPTQSRPTAARNIRPCLEALEGRDLPSTFVVTNTSDSAGPGSGSLRRAILDSNANPPAGGAVNLIQFNIPGGGPQTIAPASALPSVTAPVFIDGATQPGFLAANAPQVVLDGSGVNGNGLTLAADGCTVRGLVIDNFQTGIGLLIESSGNMVVANFIGTDATGTGRARNNVGVEVSPAAGSIKDNFLENNVISANGSFGVLVDGSVAVTVISGNLIGTDVSGTRVLGNVVLAGIEATAGAAQSLIGSNVVAGNNQAILIHGGAGGNVIANNLVGTDITGTRPLSNQDGLSCSDDGGDTIRSNLISGNEGDGMGFATDTTAGDVVVGNLIGTDLSGTRPLSNRGYGINVGTAPNSLVAGNLLSGNIIGIGLGASFNNRPPTPGILVQGNRIGTDATGAVALPNQVGVDISGRSTNNTIDSNVIAGNAQDGVRVRDDRTTGNAIQHNLIGVTSAGAPLPNGLHGIEIDNGASGNTVADNLVEFSGGHGIVLHDVGTTGNAVQGNNSSFNAGAGVLVAAGASGNSVGGTAAGQGNLLSDNGQAGAWVFGAGTTGVPIEGNAIVGNGGLGGIALTGGANNNQAPPTLVYAASTGPNDTSVSGTLSGAASTTYRVELFDSPSGGGQGQTFLGFLNVTTDGSGNATFLDHFAEALTSLTATATDPNNNTSMFSAPVAVTRL